VSYPPEQRPGPLRGGRAVVVPGGEPPLAWAPAVLTAHAVLLGIAVAVATILTSLGIQTSGHDATGRSTGTPAVVPWAAYAVAVLTVVLVVRAVGRRRLGRLRYWLAGTAAWVVVPMTWLIVAGAATSPESAGFALVLFALTPYGWFFLSPALLVGATWTGVLARMTS
jgi:hypothetical protein